MASATTGTSPTTSLSFKKEPTYPPYVYSKELKALIPSDSKDPRYELDTSSSLPQSLHSSLSIAVQIKRDERVQRVALKTLKSQKAPEKVEHFHREVLMHEYLGEKKLPLLNPLVGKGRICGEKGSMPFIATRLEGPDLFDYFSQKENPSLPIGEALRLFFCVLRSIADLHEEEVIHLDVKPENYVLDENGVPRMIDLGLATFSSEHIEEHPDLAHLQNPYARQGDFFYMSPNQLIGGRHRKWDDLWSAALMAYELASGVSPVIDKDLDRDPVRFDETLRKLKGLQQEFGTTLLTAEQIQRAVLRDEFFERVEILTADEKIVTKWLLKETDQPPLVNFEKWKERVREAQAGEPEALVELMIEIIQSVLVPAPKCPSAAELASKIGFCVLPILPPPSLPIPPAAKVMKAKIQDPSGETEELTFALPLHHGTGWAIIQLSKLCIEDSIEFV